MNLQDIVNKYLASPAFYGLAKGTQSNYLRELKKIPLALLEFEIKEIKRKDLFAYFDKNGLGYHHKSVFQRVFSFAYDRGEIDFHPLLRLKKEKLKNPPRPWTEREISIALSSENTDFAFLVKLFIYTGQRRSDVIRIKWADIFLQENYIVLKQKKTGQYLRLPIHPSLRTALLKRSRKGSYVATRNGEPWEVYGVNYVIKPQIRIMVVSPFITGLAEGLKARI